MEYGRLWGRFIRSIAFAISRIHRGGLRSAMSRLIFTVPFALLQCVHWIAFLLDELLFPRYREVEVREPVFVVGMPRTGTSFLQQVLSEDEERFTSLRLWQLVLAPSITERMIARVLTRCDRMLGRPLGRSFKRLESTVFRWMDAVHPVRLDNPEEDYLLLLPIFACFLLVAPFPEHPRVWELTRFDELPKRDRDAILGFFRSSVQRHLYVEGRDRQLLSKNPAFTPMIGSLASWFPDARFICCLRDPLEAVPSLLDSMQPAAAFFGWDMHDRSHTERFVDMLEYFARHSIETLESADPARYAFVPLPVLKSDARRTIIGVYARFGWVPSERFLRSLAVSTESGREFRSHHTYTLSDYGLTSAGVRSRFGELLARLSREVETQADPRSTGVRS